jgi:protocatechuate 3,4-dioxygenase beta subunit
MRGKDVRGVLGAVLVAVMGMADGVAAQDARVLGRVTDGIGNPVPNAAVTLVADSGGTAAQRTVSGQTGGFQFQAVAPGTYTLRAERDGFAAREQRITVRPGRLVTPVVRLTTAGRSQRGMVAARTSSR